MSIARFKPLYLWLARFIATVMSANPSCRPEQELEDAARCVLEERFGRRLSEAEWTTMRRSLVDFVKILRDWDQPSQRGNNN